MVEEHYLEWSGFDHALHSACSPEFGPLTNKVGRPRAASPVKLGKEEHDA
jgi:hypothetical protein